MPGVRRRRSVIERLTKDDNQWVRQAAERAKRKLARITTPGEKQDKKARFAFETIKDLDGTSAPRIYQAAIRVGEKYYEELAGDTAHELNTYRASMEGLLQELQVPHRGRTPATAGVNEILQKIRDRSRYLKALVNGLIEYSRDAELRFEVQPACADRHARRSILRGRRRALVLARCRNASLRSRQTIDVEVCRDRFLQALVNILSNAFESLVARIREGA